VPNDGWRCFGEDEIVARLSTVRGVGAWTAHLFLIFYLNRPDVWPIGDFGVRMGYARLHRLHTAPTPAQLSRLGDVYRPFRTVAAWYCWRVLDVPPPVVALVAGPGRPDWGSCTATPIPITTVNPDGPRRRPG